MCLADHVIQNTTYFIPVPRISRFQSYTVVPHWIIRNYHTKFKRLTCLLSLLHEIPVSLPLLLSLLQLLPECLCLVLIPTGTKQFFLNLWHDYVGMYQAHWWCCRFRSTPEFATWSGSMSFPGPSQQYLTLKILPAQNFLSRKQLLSNRN